MGGLSGALYGIDAEEFNKAKLVGFQLHDLLRI